MQRVPSGPESNLRQNAKQSCHGNSPLTTWNVGFWRWSGFRRCRWSSLGFSGCPALWAGSLLPRSGLDCPGSWGQQGGRSMTLWTDRSFLFPCCSSIFFPYSLLSRVVKLVFPGTVEALLSPSVGPYTLHSSEKLCRVRLCVLHTTDHITDQLSIGLDKHIQKGSDSYLYVCYLL